MGRHKSVIAVALIFSAGGCGSSQRPVLYPNSHLQTVGRAVAQQDVEQCLQMADSSGLSRSTNQVVERGAEGGAIGAATGSVGTLATGGNVGKGAVGGAAVGATAGALFEAFRNNANPTYRSFVQHCLHDRGYEVIGWQ